MRTPLVRVLLVDDNDDIRFLLRTRYSSTGRAEIVAEATTAEEAIALAGSQRPDVVILDNELAGTVTGMEAAPSLRQANPLGTIVLFTASGCGPDVRSVDAVIDKGGPLELLDRAVYQTASNVAPF